MVDLPRKLDLLTFLPKKSFFVFGPIIRDVTDRLWLEFGYNMPQPDSDHPGDFRVRFGAASRIFAGVKSDAGRTSDGTPRPRAIFGGGLRSDF